MRSENFFSVVAPVYDEEPILREFCSRVMVALKAQPFELLLIDDGSRDRSWEIILEESRKNPKIRGVRFSRNFGHQAALSAGLEEARGDAVILIDSDLQDPPEVIPQLIEKWKERGVDIVYAVRRERKGETFFKKSTATLFYQLLKSLSTVPIPRETGDFRLISRKVVSVLNQLPERVRFIRGLSSWAGYTQAEVFYSREPRFVGATKFSLIKMIRLGLDGITSFTSAPLQLSTYLGFFVTILAFMFAIFSLFLKLFTSAPIKGWTSLLIVMVMLGGIQLIMIGLMGEYIGRIYEEVKRRPLYLISDRTESADTISTGLKR